MQESFDVLEEEFLEAVEVKRRESAKHFLSLLLAAFELKKDANETKTEIMHGLSEMKSDVRIIAETMREGFKQIDKRFEQMDKRFEEQLHYMDKRFEQVDKRFEQVDKRFEQVDKRFEQVDKRFEQVDKRFEQVDKRFEDMNERFKSMQWLIGIGFTVVTVLTILFKFLH